MFYVKAAPSVSGIWLKLPNVRSIDNKHLHILNEPPQDSLRSGRTGLSTLNTPLFKN